MVSQTAHLDMIIQKMGRRNRSPSQIARPDSKKAGQIVNALAATTIGARGTLLRHRLVVMNRISFARMASVAQAIADILESLNHSWTE